jgi:hypothetical protein
MLSRRPSNRILLFFCFNLLFAAPSLQFTFVWAKPQDGKEDVRSIMTPAKQLIIPRVAVPPALEDFLTMQPSEKFHGRMAEVHNFIQREPSDGAPASYHTDVYLGYDVMNLYAVFVCFDSEPGKIRAHLTRREQFLPDDDNVAIMLDTFRDGRRAYTFVTNPYGIQADSLWTEGMERGRYKQYRRFRQLRLVLRHTVVFTCLSEKRGAFGSARSKDRKERPSPYGMNCMFCPGEMPSRPLNAAS